MSTWTEVSEDVYNDKEGSQSWRYESVLKTTGATVRIEIRANAYEMQSYARVSSWGRDGWHFHTSIPTGEWYSSWPSYVQKGPEHRDLAKALGRELRGELLERFAAAVFSSTNRAPAVVR